MVTSVSCRSDYLNEVVKHYYGQNLVLAYLVCLSFFRLGGNSFIYAPPRPKKCIYTPKMEYIVHFFLQCNCIYS